jgi:hypothetical protein
MPPPAVTTPEPADLAAAVAAHLTPISAGSHLLPPAAQTSRTSVVHKPAPPP